MLAPSKFPKVNPGPPARPQGGNESEGSLSKFATDVGDSVHVFFTFAVSVVTGTLCIVILLLKEAALILDLGGERKEGGGRGGGVREGGREGLLLEVNGYVKEEVNGAEEIEK